MEAQNINEAKKGDTKPTSQNILLIDNNPLFSESLQLLFKLKLNINVNIVENGESALKYLEKEKVDLLITDLYLPIMNGIELLETIHNSKLLKDHIKKIIVLTGNENSDFHSGLYELGVEKIVHKPISPISFIEKVKELIKN